MKKLLFALFVVAVSLATAVGQEDKPAEAKKYKPAESKDLIGKTVTIVGKVSQVHQAEKITHINFGRPHPNEDFTAVVFSSKTNLFDDLTKLAGKTIEVTGKVEEYRDKPQIVLNNKQQLKILDEKNGAAPDSRGEKPEKAESPKPDK